MMLGAWSSPGWAVVPATGFDADLEEDGDIQFCNGGKVENRNYLRAIVNLNQETQVLPGADSRFVDVTGTDAFCEASTTAPATASARPTRRSRQGRGPTRPPSRRPERWSSRASTPEARARALRGAPSRRAGTVTSTRRFLPFVRWEMPGGH